MVSSATPGTPIELRQRMMTRFAEDARATRGDAADAGGLILLGARHSVALMIADRKRPEARGPEEHDEMRHRSGALPAMNL